MVTNFKNCSRFIYITNYIMFLILLFQIILFHDYACASVLGKKHFYRMNKSSHNLSTCDWTLLHVCDVNIPTIWATVDLDFVFMFESLVFCGFTNICHIYHGNYSLVALTMSIYFITKCIKDKLQNICSFTIIYVIIVIIITSKILHE